jgi:acetyl-CoA synthetase
MPDLFDPATERAPLWSADASNSFTFAEAASWLDGSERLNLAHEAIIRHAQGPDGDRIAIAWRGRKGGRLDLSYRDLDELTARCADALTKQGLGRGDRVFALCDRVPELYVAALGVLRAGCVFCPLFSAFGPEPIRVRMEVGDGKALITTPGLYRRKVRGLREALPGLETVFVVHEPGGCAAILRGEEVPDRSDDATVDLVAALAEADRGFGVADTGPEDMALLHFTSGTTGKPKGAVHVHGAGIWHLASGRFALDLRPGDVFWCTADPGWVTGTSYGILAPLLAGATNVVDEGEFDPARWYRLLEEERVDVWYTAPTAIRMLMRAGPEPAAERDLSRLRLMASVGEPLNPECVRWGQKVLGRPFHDTWWQSETGGILIANPLGAPIKPGAMGRPLPGIEAAVLRRTNGSVEVLDEGEGELAIRTGWPSMFRGYLHEQARYERCFVDGWYLTGDLARKDADGTFWFVGRTDDVIKAAGHLIGPFEVESGLMEHPAAAEVAVIGKPDPLAGNIVKAFVLLAEGHEPSEDLRRELHAHARRRLGPAVAPREIEFADDLPRTRSGKIMRRLLRARELGLPEGDTSTLETPA